MVRRVIEIAKNLSCIKHTWKAHFKIKISGILFHYEIKIHICIFFVRTKNFKKCGWNKPLTWAKKLVIHLLPNPNHKYYYAWYFYELMSGGTDTKQIICFKNLLVTAFQHQFKKNAKKCLGMSKAFNNKGFWMWWWLNQTRSNRDLGVTSLVVHALKPRNTF